MDGRFDFHAVVLLDGLQIGQPRTAQLEMVPRSALHQLVPLLRVHVGDGQMGHIPAQNAELGVGQGWLAEVLDVLPHLFH